MTRNVTFMEALIMEALMHRRRPPKNIAKGAASVAAMLVTLAFVCKHGKPNRSFSIDTA